MATDRLKRLRRLVAIRALTERDAAVQLATAVGEAQQLENALALIERYSAEYSGVPAAVHSGLRLRQQAEMHSRLLEAAEMQRAQLTAAEHRVLDAQAVYQAALRERRAIETVADRRAAEAAKQLEREEQNLNDDGAAQRLSEPRFEAACSAPDADDVSPRAVTHIAVSRADGRFDTMGERIGSIGSANGDDLAINGGGAPRQNRTHLTVQI
ncbi:MAG: flagellar export protein FliJ [Thioalkalivibrionaceae bacterium]